MRSHLTRYTKRCSKSIRRDQVSESICLSNSGLPQKGTSSRDFDHSKASSKRAAFLGLLSR